MLFKFKSKATGDLIMLEPNGRRVLGIIGKEPSAQGIVTVAQMPDAIAALELAVRQDDAQRQAAMEDASAQGKPQPTFEAVSLHQRAVPLIDMLKRCHAAQEDLVWGM